MRLTLKNPACGPIEIKRPALLGIHAPDLKKLIVNRAINVSTRNKYSEHQLCFFIQIPITLLNYDEIWCSFNAPLYLGPKLLIHVLKVVNKSTI